MTYLKQQRNHDQEHVEVLVECEAKIVYPSQHIKVPQRGLI